MGKKIKEYFSNIWLPYSQMQNIKETPPLIKNAKESTLIFHDNRTAIDGIASWWSVCHGYGNKHLIKAIQTQAEKISHVMFAGIANEPAYRLAYRLINLINKSISDKEKSFSKVFFSDSGSTAVEVAMKMAVQYHYNIDKTSKKTKIMALENGYHGDTMGGMSLASKTGMHQKFQNYTPQQIIAPYQTQQQI